MTDRAQTTVSFRGRDLGGCWLEGRLAEECPDLSLLEEIDYGDNRVYYLSEDELFLPRLKKVVVYGEILYPLEAARILVKRAKEDERREETCRKAAALVGDTTGDMLNLMNKMYPPKNRAADETGDRPRYNGDRIMRVNAAGYEAADGEDSVTLYTVEAGSVTIVFRGISVNEKRAYTMDDIYEAYRTIVDVENDGEPRCRLINF